MLKDLIYTFDKETKKGGSFGEIQSNFNMSFAIDGTKDSCKIIVKSFNGDELEPYTIVLHVKTNTWWIVSKDNVERNANDSGFFYIHEIQLLGLKELLNARDLTDCGFNQNSYTIKDVIKRLFALSNFEFTSTYDTSSSPINMSETVRFMKSFENYTLLSALDEFLSAYNCSFKMHFNATIGGENEESELNDFVVEIIPKSGNTNYNVVDFEYFDDIRENKSISSQSFGTCVISNAENVISNKIKIFPSVGAIRPSGAEYDIKAQNGFIRLPSNVYKGIWLKFVGTKSPIYFDINLPTMGSDEYTPTINPMDFASIQDALNYVYNNYVDAYASSTFKQNYNNNFNQKKDLIYGFIEKAGTITLYNGNYVDPVTGDIIQGDNVPYMVDVKYVSKIGEPTKPLIFCDKDTRDTLEHPYQGIYWERGSDKIDGFNAFEAEQGKQGIIEFTKQNCDLRGQSEFVIYSDGTYHVTIKFDDAAVYGGGHFKQSSWVVAYIPMGDIKIKVDNERTKRDVKLYNQNGRLNDNYTLSKLMNSYAKEISSNKVTKFKQIYNCDNFDNVPKVGTLVNKNGVFYVITNVSLDFYQCESDEDTLFNYFIDCSFTMSKNVATKSALVDPNTNIRDYGIPQYFNVKRKQLYRDFYELNYTSNEDREWTYYLVPSKLLKFGFVANTEDDLTAIMKLTYDDNSSYYYQLPTTNYYMCKMFYSILDFRDNNIIGYCSQNAFSGFEISRVFSGQIDTVNTPIQYTDEYGKVKGFDIVFCSDSAIATIYSSYEQANSSVEHYYDWKGNAGSLYNYSIFIPQEIYDTAISSISTFQSMRINETNYNKDPIEVPVFEYACQIGDSLDCLIGDNILLQEENCDYVYSYQTGQNLTQENVVSLGNAIVTYGILQVNNGCQITLTHSVVPIPLTRLSYLTLNFYTNQSFSTNTNSLTNGTLVNVPTNVDIAIFRHSYNKVTHAINKELMFICKNVTSDKLVNSTTLRLQLNHYKLN